MIGGPATSWWNPISYVPCRPGPDGAARGRRRAAAANSTLPDAGWHDDGARDAFDHAETANAEPPPRAARRVRRRGRRRHPASDGRTTRRSWRSRNGPRNDPLAGFAPEPVDGRPNRVPSGPARMTAPNVDARPQAWSREGTASGPRARACRGTRHPASCASASPTPTRIWPRWRSGSKPPCAGRRSHGRAASRTRARRPPPRSESLRRRRRRKRADLKNLEDEMASLLGRPKSPS